MDEDPVVWVVWAVHSREDFMVRYTDVDHQRQKYPGTKHYVCLRGDQGMDTFICCMNKSPMTIGVCLDAMWHLGTRNRDPSTPSLPYSIVG